MSIQPFSSLLFIFLDNCWRMRVYFLVFLNYHFPEKDNFLNICIPKISWLADILDICISWIFGIWIFWIFVFPGCSCIGIFWIFCWIILHYSCLIYIPVQVNFLNKGILMISWYMDILNICISYFSWYLDILDICIPVFPGLWIF